MFRVAGEYPLVVEVIERQERTRGDIGEFVWSYLHCDIFVIRCKNNTFYRQTESVYAKNVLFFADSGFYFKKCSRHGAHYPATGAKETATWRFVIIQIANYAAVVSLFGSASDYGLPETRLTFIDYPFSTIIGQSW